MFRARAKWAWGWLGNLWLAKDVAVTVYAAVGFVVTPLLFSVLYHPLGPFGVLLFGIPGAAIAFLVARLFVPAVRHTHHVSLPAQTAPVATLEKHVVKAPPPVVVRSIAEQQFEIELRKFVLSGLKVTMEGLLRLYEDAADRNEGVLRGNERAHRQLDALMTAMRLLLQRGVSKAYVGLQSEASAQSMELGTTQHLTRLYLKEYVVAKDVIRRAFLAMDAAAPSQAILAEWLNAGAQCLDALRNLRTYTLAAELQHCPDGAFTSKVIG